MYEKFITIVREFNKFARHKINYKTNCNFMQQYQLKIKLKKYHLLNCEEKYNVPWNKF